MVIWRIAPLVLMALGLSLEAQTVTYFRAPASTGGIAAGPDGNLWFPTASGIAKMTPSGQLTVYPTPTPLSSYTRIAAGTDGRMWFTSPFDQVLAAISMAGVVTEYPVPPATYPAGIAAGADGNMWFGYAVGVGRITPAGVITYFPLPQAREVPDLALGNDGNIWFVQWPFNHIGRITPAGVITIFPTSVCCSPVRMARATDGTLWISFNQGVAIARVNADGSTTPEYPVGDIANSSSRPSDVEGGPDARIWFATEREGRLGRIRPDGQVVLVQLEHRISEIRGMAGGPDGNLWAAVAPPARICFEGCPPPDPTPPITVARVNLIEPVSHAEPIPTAGTTALLVMAVALAGVAVVTMRNH